MKRCGWVSDKIHIRYHDTEWGVPLHNDRKLFEFLVEPDKKIDEEIKEYHESKSVEELADIVEVIQKISKLRGTLVEDFEKMRLEKVKKRGGFEKNLFLIESNKK